MDAKIRIAPVVANNTFPQFRILCILHYSGTLVRGGEVESKSKIDYNPQGFALLEMHELSITQSILDIVLSQAGAAKANRVNKINLVIGELSGVVSDCVQFYFDFLKKGSIAEGAILSWEIVPAQLKCRNCLSIFNPDGSLWSCPNCHSQQVEIVAGREFYMESLEVE